jgi:teichuronic acid biosynthesis glycosyltransferase TuaC
MHDESAADAEGVRRQLSHPKTSVGARVLVLSFNYPSTGFPIRGVWVERLTRLAASFARPVVVSPVPWAVLVALSMQWGRLARVPRNRRDGQVEIHHPRIVLLPARALHAAEARLGYPAIRRYVDRLQRDEPFDLIHAHFIYPEGVIASRLGLRYGIPVVTTEHANWLPWLDDHRRVRRQVLAALKEIRLVIAVSPSSAETIRAIAQDRTEIRVSPNAVDDSVFRPLRNGQAVDPHRMLFVGAVRRVKGLDILIEALPRVLAKKPDAYLEVVGEPFFRSYRRDEAAVRSHVNELGLGPHVCFLGQLDQQGVARKMATSAVLAAPSRRESFGSVLIEALACGTPVVATRCGGPEDIISGSLGRLVPTEDPEALADALIDVMERRSSFNAESLHAHVKKRYGNEASRRRLQKLYSDVLVAQRAPLTPNPDIQ